MKKHDTGQVAASAAEIYEQFFVPALFAEWPGRVLAAANAQPGHSLLDVGCGTGVLAREAARVVGPGGRVVGVDVNEGMLAVARRKAPAISWKAAPAEQLPFESNSFDRVVSQFSLMFFDDQTTALQEMIRVLRPGGTIAIAVWGSLADTPGYAVVSKLLDKTFGAEAAESIRVPYSLGDPDRLRSLFTGACLTKIIVETLPGMARFPSVESWIYTDIKGWTLADVVDEEGYQRFKQEAQPALERFVRADGSVAFAAPAHIVIASPHA